MEEVHPPASCYAAAPAPFLHGCMHHFHALRFPAPCCGMVPSPGTWCLLPASGTRARVRAAAAAAAAFLTSSGAQFVLLTLW